MQSTITTDPQQLKYLTLLKERFPTITSAYTEIINLEAILNLPKGTEHFMSDIHGEYDAFVHILNNCSGVIKERVGLVFSNELSESEINDFCTLIYYPRETLELLRKTNDLTDDWYYENLFRMIRLARLLSSKYTRSKVRKAMPQTYAYIIDELLRASGPGEIDRHHYHVQILESIINTNSADDFIVSLSELIKRLAVDSLHIVGDLFDRGASPDKIIEKLISYHDVDLQWGNHDILWMGACAGSPLCIANVVKLCIRYNSIELLESGYGISLRNLALFSKSTYKKDENMSRMEKAIGIIMFKLEGQCIARHPEFEQDDRLLLEKINLDTMTVNLKGVDYPLNNHDFPTLDPEHPYDLTVEEAEVLEGFCKAFAQSQRLHRHIQFLYDIGSVYKLANDNLMFHGCVPLKSDGSMRYVNCGDIQLKGKEYFDFCDQMARRAWSTGDQDALDWMYYLWCGRFSPLSGRIIKTFERTFLDDKDTWFEPQDPYYDLTEDAVICKNILEEFGANPDHGHIINGHTPIKVKKNESPIKADGKLMVIDGGFCKAYHKKTGIAGFTLIFSSKRMWIKAHKPFSGIEAALKDNADMDSSEKIIEKFEHTIKISETDTGASIRSNIADLQRLLEAYRCGIISEKIEK